MLSSRLEAVFDEFLYKVKEEFKMAKTGDVNRKKMKNVQNAETAPTYGYKEEKPSRLDNRPSFMLKKKNQMPGWYSPMQSLSTELKTKFPKKFNKFEKNHTNECLEERIENINKRRDELRKRDYGTPVIAEPMNTKKCICKHHRAEKEPIYDIPTKTRHPRSHQHFKAEGASMVRPQTRSGHLSKKAPALSAFTLTSLSQTSSQ